MRGALLVFSLLFVTPSYSQVAEYSEGSKKVELYIEPGPCLKDAKWALYIDEKERIPGCWIVIPPTTIQISWLDGDISRFPIEIFKKPKVF